MRKHLVLLTLGLCTVLAVAATAQEAPPVVPGPVFNVRAFGAKGNGACLDTASLQRTIDACSQAGGGLVLVPRGA